jgi:hypothetical protein
MGPVMLVLHFATIVGTRSGGNWPFRENLTLNEWRSGSNSTRRTPDFSLKSNPCSICRTERTVNARKAKAVITVSDFVRETIAVDLFP